MTPDAEASLAQEEMREAQDALASATRALHESGSGSVDALELERAKRALRLAQQRLERARERLEAALDAVEETRESLGD